MKELIWHGSSKKDVASFSSTARKRTGYELYNIQCGEEPTDWKPMRDIGHGVKEIRIHLENEYRIIYVVNFNEAIHVLHAFIKKSEKTSKKDLEIARIRYKDIKKLGG